MLELIESLGFLNLGALTIAVAAPILILAYRQRIARKRMAVPSLLLLRNLTQKSASKRHIRLPLRFFLELLALLLLACAMAQPIFRDSGHRVALLLDNSFSMRALAPNENQLSTRFKQANTVLRTWLSNQSSRDSFTLYTTSPQLVRITASDSTASEVLAAAERLSPTFAADSINAEAKELAVTGDFDRVLIISDRDAELGADEDLTSALTKISRTVKFSALKVGSPVQNFYLSSLRLEHSGLREGPGIAVASIGMSGLQPAEIKISLYKDSATQAAQSSESETPLASKSVTVSPDRITDVSFDLSAYPVAEVYRAVINTGSQKDAIAEDNLGWVSREGSGSTNLLLVTPPASEGGTQEALGLRNIPGLVVTEISPDDFTKWESEKLRQYAILLFHDTAPTAVPPVPTLLILPPEGNTIFPVAAEQSAPNVTSWRSDHPLTQYLRVPLLRPGGTVIFDVPTWAQSVINVERGAIVAAGEYQGTRLAAVGMELLPFEGVRTPAVSVLTLNLLNWLSSSTDVGRGLLTGSNLRLDPGKRWKALTPNGKVAEISVGANPAPLLELQLPGAYRLRGEAKTPTGSTTSPATIKTVVANSFFPQESTTFQTASFEIPKSLIHETETAESKRPLWQILTLLSLGLLLLDLLIAMFQSKAESQSASHSATTQEA